MSETTRPPGRRSRARVIAVAGGLAVLVTAVVLIGGGGDDADQARDPVPSAGQQTQTPSQAPSPSPSPSVPPPSPSTDPEIESPAPVAGGEAEDPPEGAVAQPLPEVALPPVTDVPPEVVALDAVAEVGRSATARVVGIEEIMASGTGIGEIAGPALQVTVEVANTGTAALDVGRFSVSAYLGEAAVPASPVSTDERESPLAGMLRPGDTARGTYVFSASPADRAVLSLAILAGLDTELVVFQGDPSTSPG